MVPKEHHGTIFKFYLLDGVGAQKVSNCSKGRGNKKVYAYMRVGIKSLPLFQHQQPILLAEELNQLKCIFETFNCGKYFDNCVSPWATFIGKPCIENILYTQPWRRHARTVLQKWLFYHSLFCIYYSTSGTHLLDLAMMFIWAIFLPTGMVVMVDISQLHSGADYLRDVDEKWVLELGKSMKDNPSYKGVPLVAFAGSKKAEFDQSKVRMYASSTLW